MLIRIGIVDRKAQAIYVSLGELSIEEPRGLTSACPGFKFEKMICFQFCFLLDSQRCSGVMSVSTHREERKPKMGKGLEISHAGELRANDVFIAPWLALSGYQLPARGWQDHAEAA